MTISLPATIDPRHPLVTKQYAVYTPPIDRMISQIGDWIDQQVPGAYIYGASRLGKSRGVKWFLTSVLEERFGTVVPLIIWVRRPDSQASEAAFWHQLLLASNFMFAEAGNPPKRTAGFYLCVERFIAVAKNAGQNHVILMADEAHGLTLREWQWLTGLQNALDHQGYLLSVFSIGTHQLGYQHEYLGSTGNAHVAARFMTAHARFHGLRSEEEVLYVLTGYDDDSEWPPGSGMSFLKYFAPVDFTLGHRLVTCTGMLWTALGELSPVKQHRYRQYPMQSIASVVEAALFRLARGEAWDSVTSYKSWLDALSKVNFSDHMRLIAAVV